MIAARVGREDRELVAAVRVGDDSAFEELYRRYHHRVAAYVRGMVRDDARAEDLAQDAFFSALRGMRATDAPIAFKPWIFEIARNAAIDHWRRTSRAEEVSVDAQGLLRRSDRSRLAAAPPPETAVIDRERLGHLRGALDELPEVQTRVLVMRELEGMSYREIAERLDLSRSSVETALFRARRRLEAEYTDISEGRRCESMRAVMMRLAEGAGDGRDEERLARHARRCHSCRRRAYELGVKPLGAPGRLSRKTAALLPAAVPLERGREPGGRRRGSGRHRRRGWRRARRRGRWRRHGCDRWRRGKRTPCRPAPSIATEATRGRERERVPARVPAGASRSAPRPRRIATSAVAMGAWRRRRKHPASCPWGARRRPRRAPSRRRCRSCPDVREAVPEDAPASAPDLPAVPRLPTPEALPPVEVPVEVPVECRHRRGRRHGRARLERVGVTCAPMGAKPSLTAGDDSFLESLMDTSLYSMGAFFSDQHPDLVDEVIAQSEAIERAGLQAYAGENDMTLQACFETLLTGLAVRYYNAVAA